MATLVEQLTDAGVIVKHGLMWVDEPVHSVRTEQVRWGPQAHEVALARQSAGMGHTWVQRYAVLLRQPPNKLLCFYTSLQAFESKEPPTKVLQIGETINIDDVAERNALAQRFNAPAYSSYGILLRSGGSSVCVGFGNGRMRPQEYLTDSEVMEWLNAFALIAALP
eukprot:UN1471